MTAGTLRIGGASAFWGDSNEGVAQLVELFGDGEPQQVHHLLLHRIEPGTQHLVHRTDVQILIHAARTQTGWRQHRLVRHDLSKAFRQYRRS